MDCFRFLYYKEIKTSRIMITDFILQALLWLINLIIYPLRLLPDVSLPSEFTHSIQVAANYLTIFNNFLPMTTIFIVLSLTLAFEAGLLTYKIIMWVVKKIPTID